MTLEDGTKSVYHIFDKYFFVNTRTKKKKNNNNNIEAEDEDEETVLREMWLELRVVQKIVHFLYGPAFRNIKPAVIERRVDEWKRIQGIFKAW